MATAEFIKARKMGEVAQSYVAEMFRSWGLEVNQTPRGYRPEYDMVISGVLHGNQISNKVEVKYDRKARESGNIYLDINSLTKSQASILVICLGDPIDTTYILPLADALKLAQSHRNIRGGEFQEESALIPINQFLDLAKPKVLKQQQVA